MNARATLLVLLVASGGASAGECRKACYPDEQRGKDGCCVSKTAPKSTPGKPGAEGCPLGQEISDDTQGHCRWPGQAWNGKACVGIPLRCPTGFQVWKEEQKCAPPECLSGQVRAQDAVHCCWPEQAWSTSRAQCVGLPACPQSHAVKGESCVAVPACTGG